MTRTARRGPENKKKFEASEWKSLKTKAAPPKKSQPKVHHYAGEKGKNKSKKQQTDLLHTILHKEQRRERRRQKRAKDREIKKVCFKCRLPGHKIQDCVMNDPNQGTDVCYKCGSTEHMSSTCKAKVPQGQMPYASCYVCGKQGHIARSCPDNPRGLYPLGGGCKTCGSVEHFQRDCPEYLEKQGIGSKIVKTINLEASVDAVDDDDDGNMVDKVRQQEPQLKAGMKKKKPKVIKF